MKKDIIIPAAGESVTEADIVTWHKSNGDFVAMDEPIVELETDKASMDLTAEISGILTINVDEGTVKVGDIVGHIEESSDASAPSPVAASEPAVSASNENVTPAQPAETQTPDHYAKGHASPSAQKTLAEKGLSAEQVSGTGKDGRITKQDALAAQTAPSSAPSTSTPKKESEPISTPTPGTRTTRREPLSRLRRTLMGRLVEAQQTTASLTTFNEVDMSEVIAIRKKYKETFKEKYNVGLGFMSFFTKAAVIALQSFPGVNAVIDGTDAIYHDYCDIGFAVSTPKGLIVPVLKNVENLSFADIELGIRDFALRGRDGKVTIDEMTGGTFTITNGGTFGSMLSTPILNRPQSGILGMHNIVERPVAVNGKVEIRPIMYLALTYDHRMIDGAEAVRFLVKMKEVLEDPSRLLIGL